MTDTIMRRKMSRREMLVLASKGVACLSFASIASACGQPAAPAPAEPAAAEGEQKAAEASEAEAPKEAAPTQEEVTIEFITPGALGLERTMYENFVLKFEHEENPGINVNVTFEAWGDYMTKLPTILAGGVIPDMIHQHMSIVQEYAYRGALLELNPYMERDGVKAEDYIPALFDAFSHKGKTYGIPKDSAAWGMYFNKAMFDAAGLDYPAENWTLEDFKELATELTRDENGNPASSSSFDREKVNQWGLAWREPTPAGGGEDSRGLVKAAGGDWFSEDYHEMLLTDPAVLSILKMFHEMRCVTGSIPTPAQAQGQGDPFRAGLTAMQVSFHIGTFFAKQENVKFDYDVRFLPAGPGGQYSVVGCSGWAVPSQATHKEEAWALVKYLTSLPVQTYIGQQKRWGVSLKEAVSAIEPDDGYPENFAKVHTDPFKGNVDVEVISLKYPPQISRIREIFASELEPVWTCTTDDVETAASNAKTQVDEVLASLNW